VSGTLYITVRALPLNPKPCTQVPVSGTLYITVRAHDLNYEDRVTISVKEAVSPNFPARQIAVSDSYWSNLKWLGDTHCPRISKDGKICEDGWWERTGGSQALNPKP
jgi:hypothetical protein